MKRKALGRGLRSLIPEAPARGAPDLAEAPPRPGQELLRIDIDRIHPNRKQPRKHFEQTQLEELARSLGREGVLQPVIVRPAGNGSYELVAGERRWRAAQLAGLMKIPAVVREVADDQILELALLENLQREGLNPIETASAFRTLIDELGLTQQDVAERVGKDRATVANLLRLLNLPTAVQDLVKSGQISLGHAKVLASLGSPPRQVVLAERTVAEALSVRQLEALVRRTSSETAPSGSPAPVRDPNVADAEQRLQQAMGTKVSIVLGKKGGRVEVHFYSHDELQRVYQLLMKASPEAART